MEKSEVYIVAAKRSGIGGYQGALSSLSAIEIGGEVLKSLIATSKIKSNDIEEIILGNVLSANLGQSPTRQVSKLAGIPDEVDATTINKVCSSGLKTVSYGAQSIQTENSQVVVVGGMESMSNCPFYIDNHRNGHKIGHHTLIDGMIKDGLWDPYHNFHMGNAAELVNNKYKITREEQDQYTINSFLKSEIAQKNGVFSNEIVPIEIRLKKETKVFQEDEDIKKFNLKKITQLPPIFDGKGSITAASASNLNDGAAMLIIVSKKYLEENNLKPLVKIVSFSDAAQSPEWFSISPSLAINKTLAKVNMNISDIDYFEINEAYANVPIVNSRILEIDINKVNVFGGAVALGHPLGASGARILVTLINVLKYKGGKYGIAAICNGGGGSTAMLVENIL